MQAHEDLTERTLVRQLTRRPRPLNAPHRIWYDFGEAGVACSGNITLVGPARKLRGRRYTLEAVACLLVLLIAALGSRLTHAGAGAGAGGGNSPVGTPPVYPLLSLTPATQPVAIAQLLTALQQLAAAPPAPDDAAAWVQLADAPPGRVAFCHHHIALHWATFTAGSAWPGGPPLNATYPACLLGQLTAHGAYPIQLLAGVQAVQEDTGAAGAMAAGLGKPAIVRQQSALFGERITWRYPHYPLSVLDLATGQRTVELLAGPMAHFAQLALEELSELASASGAGSASP